MFSNENRILITPELKSVNPSLLRHLKDSIVFDANIFYNYQKGDFVNYYQANEKFKTGLQTHSYIRLNNKITVYGLASYYYGKGKNSGGTSFLYPYRIPFNFTPSSDSTKGDNRLEQYRLVGAISYKISPKLSIGTKIDYQTISYAKLRDMRNINDILQLNFHTGVDYKLSDNQSIGLNYHYDRYIENMQINKYGKSEDNYFALLNRGAFMGFLHVYGDDGILDARFKHPWVEIIHNVGLQYVFRFNEIAKLISSFSYGKGKGHYGNDQDNSVVYMRHTKNIYSTNNQLNIKVGNTINIIKIEGNYNSTANNEQLYREVTTEQGNSITEYYGANQSLKRKLFSAKLSYNLLFGTNYENVNWQINVDYAYNQLNRKVSSFPYYRKQNIKWHKYNANISKFINNKFLIKYSVGFGFGNGGMPVDTVYVATTDASKPDYLDDLLYKEREYFIAKRLTTGLTLKAYKTLKQNNLYAQLHAGYTHAFNTEYLKNSVFVCELSLGLVF